MIGPYDLRGPATGRVEPRTMGRRLLPAAVVAVLVTVAGWAFGLGWGSALAVALATVAVVELRRTPQTDHDEGWPAPPDAASDHGVRREVTRLSWSLQGHESRVERPSLLRLRALADHRLGQRGLHLDDPTDADACRGLLGERAHQVLTAGPRTQVRFEAFSATLAAVEKLTTAEPGRPTEEDR